MSKHSKSYPVVFYPLSVSQIYDYIRLSLLAIRLRTKMNATLPTRAKYFYIWLRDIFRYLQVLCRKYSHVYLYNYSYFSILNFVFQAQRGMHWLYCDDVCFLFFLPVNYIKFSIINLVSILHQLQRWFLVEHYV